MFKTLAKTLFGSSKAFEQLAPLIAAGEQAIRNNDLSEAKNVLERAEKVSARHPDVLTLRAKVQLTSGDREDAELTLIQALATAPDNPMANALMGEALLQLQRADEAICPLRRALELSPSNAEARNALSLAMMRMNDYQGIIDLLGASPTPYPPLSTDELYRLGTALYQSGCLEEAEKVLSSALPSAQFKGGLIQTLAFKHLMAGNWGKGFELYEERLSTIRANPEYGQIRDWIMYIDHATRGIPTWQGEDIAGKRLLIWTEQGQGDTIMLARLLKPLLDTWKAREVTILCAETLLRLIGEGIPGIKTIKTSPGWRAPAGAFDIQCSIMSLPYLMKLQPDNIPGQVPYLRVPQPIVDRWSESLSTVSGFRVGVVWNNSQVPKFGDMRLRNVPLHELTTVFSVSGGSFVSLQRDEPSREMLHANGLPLTDCMDECFDFMDTAGIIQNLDLVISICTAVAHLAGALGKPVWLLNRFESEWRWMRNREDSVWYPSMRIFNQPQSRQWAPVIAQVSEALRTTIDKRH